MFVQIATISHIMSKTPGNPNESLNIFVYANIILCPIQFRIRLYVEWTELIESNIMDAWME